MKHTPGPWNTMGTDVLVTAGRICKAQIELTYGTKIPKEEALANGRLIAAAPELLEALEACAGDMLAYQNGLDRTWGKSLKKAQAAILKAVGKT